MPLELFKRLDLDFLYPPLLEKLLAAVADCAAGGREYVATLGYRTWAQQDALYARGRTAPGVRVTNAKAGESAHNYGLAVDFFAALPREAGGPLAPDWSPAAYDALGAAAKRQGLLWGGDWTVLPDRPHVQWPGYATAGDMAPLLAAFTSPLLPQLGDSTRDALQRVWALIDKAAK
jgi:hypothetical protein